MARMSNKEFIANMREAWAPISEMGVGRRFTRWYSRADETPFRRIGIPPCIACGHDDFIIVRPFTFAVDRLIRGRVKGLLRCKKCGMQAIVMRWGDGRRWSWFESN